MKDAYSFDVSEEKAVASYLVMYQAYERIFRRCGLSFRPVEADTGAIGGSRSHEFQVLAESGEDTLVACSACDYAANVEQAEWAAADRPTAPGVTSTRQVVATPGKKTIEEVASFLKLPAERLIKTLLYVADGKPHAVLVRGDRAVNEIKLKKMLGAVELFMAADNHVQELTGAPAGFAGPIGLSIPIVADDELRGMIGAVAGANQADAHITGIDVDRDVPGARWGRLRLAVAGDRCPRCADGRFQVLRGIEVGHVFYLGTKYSAPMACTFLAEDGTARPMEMGCYGIGVTRVAAAAIEQNHDNDGIVWPMSIAPYEVALLTLQANEPEVVAAAERLYAALTAKGIEVLFDDREERPGAKFKDADLIGVPLRLAVGKKSLAEGRVELKWRRDKQVNQIAIDDAVDHVAGLVAAERARLAGA
jgi:prolyl-tRNA synthetase